MHLRWMGNKCNVRFVSESIDPHRGNRHSNSSHNICFGLSIWYPISITKSQKVTDNWSFTKDDFWSFILAVSCQCQHPITDNNVLAACHMQQYEMPWHWYWIWPLVKSDKSNYFNKYQTLFVPGDAMRRHVTGSTLDQAVNPLRLNVITFIQM